MRRCRCIASYLEQRKQRTNVNGPYSNFYDVFSGNPQDSLLCPLLFNMYICGLFFGNEDLGIVIYADDNTPCTFFVGLDVALKKLTKVIQ